MPGCLSYVVAKDANDENTIWVTEVWDSMAGHDASLSLPAVRNAIPRGKAIVSSFEKIAATSPVWGSWSASGSRPLICGGATGKPEVITSCKTRYRHLTRDTFFGAVTVRGAFYRLPALGCGARSARPPGNMAETSLTGRAISHFRWHRSHFGYRYFGGIKAEKRIASYVRWMRLQGETPINT
jgi:hypothetical protein